MSDLLLESGAPDNLLLESGDDLLLDDEGEGEVPATRPQQGLTGVIYPPRFVFYQPHMMPVYEVPPVIAPIPPGTEHPPQLARLGPGWGIDFPWMITPGLPGGGLPTIPGITPDQLIRRVTRWTAEDRCTSYPLSPRTLRWTTPTRTATYQAQARTVRWTRPDESSIMPERDDHYR